MYLVDLFTTQKGKKIYDTIGTRETSFTAHVHYLHSVLPHLGHVNTMEQLLLGWEAGRGKVKE